MADTSVVRGIRDAFSNANNALGGIPSLTGGSQSLTQKGERLFNIRPRYATPITNSGLDNSGTAYVSDRGTNAKIKLLTSDSAADIISNIGGAIKDANDKQILVNAITDLTNMQTGYQNFLVTDVQVSFNEKLQVTELFGDANVAYYFGSAPVMYNISGLLIDSIDNDWFTSFIETYGQVLRGTKLAANYQLIQLELTNTTVIGSVTALAYSQNAARDTDIPFTMQILAKVVQPVSYTPEGYAKGKGALNIDFTKVSSLTGFSALAGLQSLLAGKGFNTTPNPGSGTASAGAFQNSIFSPVYGVINSITQTVQGTGGIGVVSGITNVLKGIQNDAVQVTSVIQAAENGLNTLVNGGGIFTQLQSTLQTLKNTAGVITSIPNTLTSILAKMTGSGSLLTGAAFLSGSSGGTSTAALLSGGTGNTASTNATISSGGASSSSSATLTTANSSVNNSAASLSSNASTNSVLSRAAIL